MKMTCDDENNYERVVILPFCMMRRLAMLYLAFPTILFLAGWLHAPLAVVSSLVVIGACLCCFRRQEPLPCMVTDSNVPQGIPVRIPVLVACAVIIFLWCVFCGQGAFVAQMHDWHWRNAVLRDMITHDWPVRYRAWGGALVFYVGHWLPAAVVGRICYLMTGDLRIAWQIGNAVLFFWTYLGVALVLALMMLALNAKNSVRQLGVLALLVVFGGTSQIGFCLLNVRRMIGGEEITSWLVNSTRWAEFFEYTPNTVLLSWAFHQALATWLATVILVMGCSLRQVAWVVSLALICAPMPALGLVMIAFCLIGVELWRTNLRVRWKHVLVACLSPENLVGVLVILPIVGAYYAANPQSGTLTFAWTGMSKSYFFHRYALFVLGECGLYLVLTGRLAVRSPLWWSMAIGLCAYPLFKVSQWSDFCMRATIPSLVILSLFVLASVFATWKNRCCWAYLLIVSLILGTGGALIQTRRTIRETREHVGSSLATDQLVTLDQDFEKKFGWWVVMHCCSKDPDKSFFFRKLARRSSDGN